MCDDCARERAAREMADARIEELLTAVNRKHALAVKAEEAREAAIREHEEREEKLHETNERLALSLVDAESALAAEREAHAETRKEINALTNERNAALELAEKRGAAYDMTWREVESLRERLDKEEEERGRQYGLRVQAEAEVGRLMALVREWLDGNARLGRPKSIADQRFLNGLNAEVRDSRQTEKAKDSEPPLRAENERLRKELQGVANHLLSMSGGAHNCAGCGFLHKQIVRALAAPPEEK